MFAKVRVIAPVIIHSAEDNAYLMKYMLSSCQYHRSLPFSSQPTQQGLLHSLKRRDKTYRAKMGIIKRKHVTHIKQY